VIFRFNEPMKGALGEAARKRSGAKEEREEEGIAFLRKMRYEWA